MEKNGEKLKNNNVKSEKQEKLKNNNVKSEKFEKLEKYEKIGKN